MAPDIWQITRFTIAMAAVSTLLILPAGLLVAWALARGTWLGKSLVETLVALPLVMPPVATGLILLKLFGRFGVLGNFLQETFGIEVVFTWRAVVVASAVMAFPLLVRTARVAFEDVDPRLEQVARTLGAGRWRTFFTITLPLARNGAIAGVLLSFARALGEFGATIMIAGYIPGATATLSLSIYQLVQLGHDDKALRLLIVSVAISFVAVLLSEFFIRRTRR
ncbi:MAG TPA: molybdate ABC transporter permease subunit [Opitutaceae bacterium]|nr:molybdate ABC transporter permease subunit [Opitutaceae bacterium]